jgi:hypothetical protein
VKAGHLLILEGCKGMNAWFELWWKLAQLNVEAQQVMALRLFRFAAGGPFNITRLSNEKFDAAIEAIIASAQAAASGKAPAGAAGKAVSVYRRRVRANMRGMLRSK